MQKYKDILQISIGFTNAVAILSNTVNYAVNI